jgi:hypothetical protein
VSAAWGGTATGASAGETAGSLGEARADAEVWLAAHPGGTAWLGTAVDPARTERARQSGGQIVWERAQPPASAGAGGPG